VPQPSVSVVIVSHARADALCVALTAVAQVDYPNFEIVVVADAKSMAAVRAHPLADLIKTVIYDTPQYQRCAECGHCCYSR